MKQLLKMTVIAGIPSWVQMYFEKLIDVKKRRLEIFLKILIYLYTAE